MARLEIGSKVGDKEIATVEQVNTKAPLVSPTFTGTVVLPSTTSIGNVTSTEIGYLDNVTSAIQTQLNAKAPLASPVLTGTPTAPTQAADNNSTSIATTAFVTGQAGSVTPIMDGSATAGSSLRYARQDHVHPADTSKANLSGANFTGTNTHSRNLVSQPKLKDYSEAVSSNATATGTVNLDISNGNVFAVTLIGDTTLSFTNPATTGQACSFTLILNQDATKRTVTFPLSVKWNDDEEPDLSNISKTIILTFLTVDGGTRWYGFLSGNNFTT